MMIFWPKSSRTSLRRSPFGTAALLVCCLLCCVCPQPARAQAGEDVLSQKEVDQLRDAAFSPNDRLQVFVQILTTREQQIKMLLAKRRGHTDFAGEMHDIVDQFGAIADELNDNLDEYTKQHRDVRKTLPKLLEATDRWTATLRSPEDNEAYAVVRRIAVDNVKDTHELATTLQTELAAYFKAHPEAEKAEKQRNGNPHAVHDVE